MIPKIHSNSIFHVEDGAIVDQFAALLYESDALAGLSEAAVQRLAELSTEFPDLDWEGVEDLLVAEGLIRTKAGQIDIFEEEQDDTNTGN